MTMTITHSRRSAPTMPAPSDITPVAMAVSELGVPQGHVLVLGLLPLREGVLEGVKTGNLDLVMQGVPYEEFLRTIRVLIAETPTNDTAQAPPALRRLSDTTGPISESDDFRVAALTSRERQVMGLIGAGMSNRQIATQLNVAVHTVKTHVHKVLGKLAVRTRLEVAALVHAADRARVSRHPSRVA